MSRLERFLADEATALRVLVDVCMWLQNVGTVATLIAIAAALQV